MLKTHEFEKECLLFVNLPELKKTIVIYVILLLISEPTIFNNNQPKNKFLKYPNDDEKIFIARFNGFGTANAKPNCTKYQS